jgi:drug/metabolite transporter (DMT)-like permease
LDNIRGAILMILSMAGFAIEDMFIKQMADALPVGQILCLLGVGGAVVFGGLALRRGDRLWSAALWHRAVVLRNAGEVTGTIGIILALSLIPLSTASAILQANPLQVASYAFATLVPTGLGMLLVMGDSFVRPDLTDALRLAAALGFGTLAYYGIVAATRLGDISVVAPFRYSRIVFALIVGFVAFNERPDALTLLGVGLVVTSGLYMFLREANMRRRAFTSARAAL